MMLFTFSLVEVVVSVPFSKHQRCFVAVVALNGDVGVFPLTLKTDVLKTTMFYF